MEKAQQQAREEILGLVADYCQKYHLENKKEYEPGDRIPYASRVYDAKEMVNLVDSALEFWLTSGRYTEEFEEKFECYQKDMEKSKGYRPWQEFNRTEKIDNSKQTPEEVFFTTGSER